MNETNKKSASQMAYLRQYRVTFVNALRPVLT